MAFDLNDEELKATREMNGADKKVMSEEEILKYTKNIINATYIEATDIDDNGNIIEQGLVNQKVIQGLLDLYNKEKEKNKELEWLKDEREHIKSNLKVDLNRKGVLAQAKGQIKQILDYYESNEKYFTNLVEKERK